MKTLIFFLFISLLGCETKKKSHPQSTPKTMFPIIKTDVNSPQRLQDLAAIAYALEKYKQDNRQYPISSRNGKGYDAIIANEKYGQSRKDWITGLAPKYISQLPTDPRHSNTAHGQYLYRSNGAHYKLLVTSAPDCNEIKAMYPTLIDPTKDCWAYGYWTEKALKW